MIINKENFWHEVRLLALNNYGPWKNLGEVRTILDQAVEDTFEEAKNEIDFKEEFQEIFNEMTNDLEANND